MKIPWKYILGTAGLVLALGWSVMGVDFTEVGKILGEMNRSIVCVVLLLTTVNLVIRALVWKYVVSPIKPVSLKYAIQTYLIGVFSNLFLPFKLGDVAQGYSMGRRQQISSISTVSAVLVQRIFEVSSLFFVMAVVGVVFSFPLLFERKTLVLGIAILLGIMILFFLYKNSTRVISLIENLVGRFSSRAAEVVSKAFGLFLEGTMAIHKPIDVAKIFSLSLLSWLVQITMVNLTANALGISIDIVASSVVLLMINLGLIIPLAPGNIGTFQFFSILALSMFSISKSKSLSFAIIFQVIQGVPVIIGGAISLFQEMIFTRRGIAGSVNGKKKITIPHESLFL